MMEFTHTQRCIGDWVLSSHLGQGSYANVYKALHKTTGEVAAIKEINLSKLNSKLRQSLKSEIAILKRISHPNIVKLHEVIQEGGRLYLVMEYCAGGDLAQLLRTVKRLPEANAKHLMQQLAEGLKAMWSRHLVHRDLKPQNLLLSEPHAGATLKIADFGFARNLQPQGLAETLCGSPLYMAPEILQLQRYDAKADLWSVGAILFELVSGHPPFTGANQFALLRAIERSEATLPDDVVNQLSPQCIHLLRCLLRRNPVERISFEEFFAHEFLLGPLSSSTTNEILDAATVSEQNQQQQQTGVVEQTDNSSKDNNNDRVSVVNPLRASRSLGNFPQHIVGFQDPSSRGGLSPPQLQHHHQQQQQLLHSTTALRTTTTTSTIPASLPVGQLTSQLKPRRSLDLDTRRYTTATTAQYHHQNQHQHQRQFVPTTTTSATGTTTTSTSATTVNNNDNGDDDVGERTKSLPFAVGTPGLPPPTTAPASFPERLLSGGLASGSRLPSAAAAFVGRVRAVAVGRMTSGTSGGTTTVDDTGTGTGTGGTAGGTTTDEDDDDDEEGVSEDQSYILVTSPKSGGRGTDTVPVPRRHTEQGIGGGSGSTSSTLGQKRQPQSSSSSSSMLTNQSSGALGTEPFLFDHPPHPSSHHHYRNDTSPYNTSITHSNNSNSNSEEQTSVLLVPWQGAGRREFLRLVGGILTSLANDILSPYEIARYQRGEYTHCSNRNEGYSQSPSNDRHNNNNTYTTSNNNSSGGIMNKAATALSLHLAALQLFDLALAVGNNNNNKTTTNTATSANEPTGSLSLSVSNGSSSSSDGGGGVGGGLTSAMVDLNETARSALHSADIAASILLDLTSSSGNDATSGGGYFGGGGGGGGGTDVYNTYNTGGSDGGINTCFTGSMSGIGGVSINTSNTNNSSTVLLPHPWETARCAALRWAENAAADELLGNYTRAEDLYTRAGAVLHFLAAEASMLKLTPPASIGEGEAVRLRQCAAAAAGRRAACAVLERGQQQGRLF